MVADESKQRKSTIRQKFLNESNFPFKSGTYLPFPTGRYRETLSFIDEKGRNIYGMVMDFDYVHPSKEQKWTNFR
jgi:hypothetical protein